MESTGVERVRAATLTTARSDRYPRPQVGWWGGSLVGVGLVGRLAGCLALHERNGECFPREMAVMFSPSCSRRSSRRMNVPDPHRRDWYRPTSTTAGGIGSHLLGNGLMICDVFGQHVPHHQEQLARDRDDRLPALPLSPREVYSFGLTDPPG
jgi:hypothetical protein